MKRLLLGWGMLLACCTLMAQTPQGIHYQAIARDSGEVLVSTPIQVRATIYTGGLLSYQETHSVVTNGFGLFTLVIGEGISVMGQYDNIDWGLWDQALEMEVDLGNGYVSMGQNNFRNVPYALASETALIATAMEMNDLLDVDTSGLVPGQILQWDGSNWIPALDGDADPGNELQSLSISGNNLSLSNGNTVNIPTTAPTYSAGMGIGITGNVITNTGDLDDSDDITSGTVAGGDLNGTYPDPTVTAIQSVPVSPSSPLNGEVLKFQNGQWQSLPDLLDDADADATNEIQTLNLSGNALSLSNGGGSVNLPVYTAGVGISISGNTISNTGDPDASDDLVVGSTAGGDLGGTYPDPSVVGIQGYPVSNVGPIVGEILKWDGSAWTTSTDLGGNWTSSGTDANLDAGNARIRNSANQVRVEVGTDGSDNGFVHVYDTNDILKAGIRINAGQGEVFGDAKNFRMEHPEHPNKEIWYASLEGPEAAAYARGTASLEDGKAHIKLPDHFRLLAAEGSITVLLTPLSGTSKGLAVVEKGAEGFSVVELLEGKGSYAFDWEVKAIRKGFENFEVIRDK